MSRAWRIGGPTGVLLSLLALWALVTGLGWVDPLVLPSPVAVFGVFWNQPWLMATNAGITATEAIIGLILGNACGLLLAIIFVSSASGRRAVLPLAMAAQAVPIVAVTPALIIGFGDGMEPKILVATFLVFFPMLVNGMRGLRSADAEVGELMHSLDASAWQRLWMVRLPAALPFIFTALKFSACSSFVAAIVAEWVAANKGLGYLIVFAGSQYRSDEVWAAVLIGTLSSMILVGLVVLLERRVMPWANDPTEGLT
ncbi:ABC transporter permease [Acidisoma cellulosilytica]|uniref:ABC transporter permease n=1 Tax=Acidisoma cellulosilyticum TaxID=2802395 RepID=A0A963Z302_9PROT|nr:ABC transporter permease [Acidisoma cellulosilyticum]MCB8881591.1 ABC transporter permease [Acidisoma cellulosilyticum]